MSGKGKTDAALDATKATKQCTVKTTPHEVEPGDTLSEIAEEYELNFYNKSDRKQILDCNPQISDPNKIIAGDTIYIPINAKNHKAATTSAQDKIYRKNQGKNNKNAVKEKNNNAQKKDDNKEPPFNPNTTFFDLGNAYWSAKLSEAVYGNHGDWKKGSTYKIYSDKKWITPKNIIPYDEGGTQAVLLVYEKFIFMVFRGSDELKDWSHNIFKGFEHALKHIVNPWNYKDNKDVSIVRDYTNQDLSLPLFIAGHSLGGALATLVTQALIYGVTSFVSIIQIIKIKPASVYTFGQPAVFKPKEKSKLMSKHREFYTKQFFRFHHKLDPIPLLPLGRHIGTSKLTNNYLKNFDGNFKKYHDIKHYIEAILILLNIKKFNDLININQGENQ